MKTPLHKQLTDYIKLHGRVHFRDIEKYAEENGYKAYTAIRRLQEVRDPDHKNYDPAIKTVAEGTTIKWYVFESILPDDLPYETKRYLEDWGPNGRFVNKQPPEPKNLTPSLFP